MEKNINNIYREYYNECLYIMMNYNKIKNNPHQKVHALTKQLILLESICLMIMIIGIITYLFTKYIPILILLVPFTFLFIQNAYTHLLANKRIRDEINNKVVNKVTNKVNSKKDEIILSEEHKDEKNKKVTIEKSKAKWEDILYIIMNKNTICYLPKEDATKIICVSINEKEQILKDIQKYNRQDLLVDNTGLYL